MAGLRDDLEALLEAVRRGVTSPQEALEQLSSLPFRDLGFARIDIHRELRQGAPEAVLAEGKTPEQVARIVAAMLEEGAGGGVVTRAGGGGRGGGGGGGLVGMSVVVQEDVGVAGVHRLGPVLPDLERADCVVVVAGMDAALASLVGGLARGPVIGVPTSVGYGSAHGGAA